MQQNVPGDLRDAVSDGAYGDLAGTASAPAAAPAVSAPAPTDDSDAKSIYGDDNRLDYYQTSAAHQQLSRSIVSLWKKADVTVSGAVARLSVVPFGRALGLCPNEKFREQPIGAFCSGSLIKDDVIMTAGHCILDQAACDNTKFVFGFQLNRAGQYPNSVPASDVYQCKSIIKRDLDTNQGGIWNTIVSIWNGGPGPDFALVKLDRKVTGRAPLTIASADPRNGEKLFVIGHPVGLPLKDAGDASVKDASPTYFYRANLDTFGGNSGSAVFNSQNKVAGILVRGDTDFTVTPAGCRASVVYPQSGEGEAVTKISALLR